MLKVSLFGRAAPEQGGLLSGVDPTAVNTNDPLRLWIIQLCIIVVTAQLLAGLLKKINQPKVIAEVLGGIVLGPTALGRIPGFTEHIFPTNSLPFLSLTANIALVLFLFLVGLEINLSSLRAQARSSAFIALGGMILPFSIGSGMAKLIFENFVLTDPTSTNSVFSHFLLFVGVAYSITAFPVLCRILSELKLLDTTVGVCVLSAGVCNDIIGWTLLALSVALVNATSGITALYIILIAIAWSIFMLVPVKWAWGHLARYSNPSPSQPSLTFTTLTLILVFGSAWFTDVIGVHAIFGGFLAGLVVPRTGGLAIAMMEKVEDLVGGLLLPLYFTYSGLSTNLGLINTGKAWGYTIAIIATAWFGKFFGAASGGKAAGFGIRESATIGTLMSCKGLVELIVLNVGLQAGILSTRVFSMFVLEALVLTFFTTPVVVKIYPPHLRVRAHAGRDELGHSHSASPTGASDSLVEEKLKGKRRSEDDLTKIREDTGEGADRLLLRRRFTFVLDRMEHLPGMVCMAQLLRPPAIPVAVGQMQNLSRQSSTSRTTLDHIVASPPPPTTRSNMILSAFRLIELSDRTSAVMKSISMRHQDGKVNDSERDNLAEGDAMLGVFRILGGLWGFGVRCALEVTPNYLWAQTVKEHALNVQFNEEEDRGDTSPEGKMLIIGCVTPHGSYPHSQRPVNQTEKDKDFLQVPEHTATNTATNTLTNPFDALFKSSSNHSTQTDHLHHSDFSETHFLRSVFAKSKVDVALFVDQQRTHPTSFSGGVSGHTRLFLPFFGGPDDRLALELVAQMVASGEGRVKASVVWIESGSVEVDEGERVDEPLKVYLDGDGGTVTLGAFPDTVYGAFTTQTRLQSQTADALSWEQYSTSTAPSATHITYSRLRTPQPIHALLNQLTYSSPASLLIVVGRSRRLAVESHRVELKSLEDERGVHMSSDIQKTMGDVGAAIVYYGGTGGVGEKKCDVVVVQAGLGGSGEA